MIRIVSGMTIGILFLSTTCYGQTFAGKDLQNVLDERPARIDIFRILLEIELQKNPDERYSKIIEELKRKKPDLTEVKRLFWKIDHPFQIQGCYTDEHENR